MRIVAVWMMVWAVCAAGALPSGLGVDEAPVDVTVADIGGGRVLVSWLASWEDDSRGEELYRVERKCSRADESIVAEVLVSGDEMSVVDESGDGAFRYRVTRVSGGEVSAFSPWFGVIVTSGSKVAGDDPDLASPPAEEILRGIRIGNDGWSVLEPSVDSRIVYVSSSMGSDRNDGLSQKAPKRTIQAGYEALRSGYPDWLLLKGGDTWIEGELRWSKSGRSPQERMVLGVYGSDERAVWKSGQGSAVRGDGQGRRTFANLVFRDLHLIQHENEGTSGGAGFMLMNGWRDVLIENCRVEQYRVNMVFQAHAEGAQQQNIVVRRNVIIDALALNDAHAQGIYADGVDGLLIEENVLDRNGWGPDAPTANMFRHNTYIQTRTGGDRGCTNVVSRGNISARASATGLMQRPGGVMEDNLLLANPVGIVFGQNGGPEVAGRVRRNVVLDARNINDRTPRGTGLWLTELRDVDVSQNIIAHQRSGTGTVVGINIDGTYADLHLRENLVYDWTLSSGGRGVALAWHGAAEGPVQVVENHFQQVGGGYVVAHYAPLSEVFEYADNVYYSAGGEFWRDMNYDQFRLRAGESGAFAQQSYPEAERTIDTYMKANGRSGGLEEFLEEARKQSRANWREIFTAGAVIEYVREGFGVEKR